MVEHLPERSWELTAGDPVETSDGTVIGRVAEVRGAYFRVDVRLEADFWLETARIRSAGTGSVLLDFPGDELNAHRLTSPPDEG